jgi:hypothetical protein
MELSAVPLEKAGDRDGFVVHFLSEQAYMRLLKKVAILLIIK